MVIPWALVASVAAAAAAAWLWLRWAASRTGVAPGAVTDLLSGLLLAGIIGARLAGLAVDAVTQGQLPLLRAVLSLGAGLSAPAGLLAALGAAVVHQRRHAPEKGVWHTAAVAAAVGLAVWSAASLLRGEVAGIAAPPPLGVALPGVEGTWLPVGLLEALAFAAAGWWVARRAVGGGVDSVAAVGLAASGIHLLGGLLRPSLATVDRDVDVLLGVTAAAVFAVVATRRPLPWGVRLGGLAGVPTLAAALLAAALLATPPTLPAAAEGPPAVAGALVADRPPGGTVPAWDGADLAGFVAAQDRPVVVNLWASWCPPCHAEAPALARAAAALDARATVVGVLVDDAPQRGQAFADRYRLPFPTVVDAGVSGAVGSGGLPTTVVLRPDGTLAERIVGGVDARSLAAAVARAAG